MRPSNTLVNTIYRSVPSLEAIERPESNTITASDMRITSVSVPVCPAVSCIRCQANRDELDHPPGFSDGCHLESVHGLTPNEPSMPSSG